MVKFKLLLVLSLIFYGCVKNEHFILSEHNYKMWRDYIKPSKKELAWNIIPWRSSFLEGINHAKTEEKPLLLWVMNGHPLGCT